jgi:hypothetical protein
MTIFDGVMVALLGFGFYKLVLYEIRQYEQDERDDKEIHTVVGRDEGGGIFYYDIRDKKQKARDTTER